MPVAEIITIGTEILLGEIVDTNSQFIACKLREAGIDLYRKTTVGDNPGRIADAIREAFQRCDIIITTGGLGPTVDDPTREAVAQTLGLQLEFHPELWDQIQNRFKRFGRPATANNRRQAYVPAGAIIVENPVGTAPAFIVTKGKVSIVALPGVPREMEYLLENKVLPLLISQHQASGVIKARTLHTVGAGESQIDDLIGDLEELRNPTVGLAAHTGQVDVRITAKAASVEEADRMISQVETEVRNRLGEWIYGADQDSLEEIALEALAHRGWTLAIIEVGTNGELSTRLSSLERRLTSTGEPLMHPGEVLLAAMPTDEFTSFIRAFRQKNAVDVCLGVAIQPEQDRQEIQLALITPQNELHRTRPYGGPPSYASRWAIHHSLDLLRRL